MAGKRRTKAEIEADKAEEGAEFIRLLEDYKKDHPPEACSCAARFIGTDFMYPDIFNKRSVYAEKYETYAEQVQADIERRMKAGMTEYVWKTSDRFGIGPCERCKSYEGKTFRYDSPPPGGHPGIAPGCNCLMDPIIPGYEPRELDVARMGRDNRYLKEWQERKARGFVGPPPLDEIAEEKEILIAPKRKMRIWVKVLIAFFALSILAALFG